MKLNRCLRTIVLLLFFAGSKFVYPQSQAVAGLVDSLSIDNIRTHISSLVWAGGHETRSTFTAGNRAAAQYIYEYLSSLKGLTEVKLDTFKITNSLYPYSTYDQFNVVATLKGSADSPEIILLGGHYDTSGSREDGYNEYWRTTFKARGADDNATGVAAIMEIARVLSDSTTGFNNKHTFKFIAFGAEEYHPMHSNAHHVGSLFDAENMYNADDPLTAVIILDMIGFNENYDYTEVISNQQSLWLADQVYDSRDKYVPDLLTNSTPSDVPYSDHESYQEYGFSAILLMENDRPWNDHSPYYKANPYYHTSNDIPNTLNYNLVEKVAKLALATSTAMSLRDDPTSVEDKFQLQNNLPVEFAVSAYPNPFNGLVNIEFNFNRDNRIDMTIYDVLGRKIESVYSDRVFNAGTHKFTWDSGSNPSGIYYCILQTKYGTASRKLMLIK